MYRGIIVDDAAIMRMRLREILEREFTIVAEASNGKEAVALAAEYRPDFVTLDISMPEVNGLDALKSLLGGQPTPKVVIVSAVGQKQVVFDALGMGARDFIVKPFEPERVLKAVKRLFE